MARHQLGHRSRTVVAQQLEPGNHRRRLRARVGAVDLPALLGALENRDEDLEQEPLRAGHLDPGVRELERGLEQRRPREPPVARVSLGEPRDEPGNGNRPGADVKDLRRRVAEVDQHLVHRLLRP